MLKPKLKDISEINNIHKTLYLSQNKKSTHGVSENIKIYKVR